MAGFADLVAYAQPALLGGGCFAEVTEGRTWEWAFDDITDDTGAPVDLTGVTAECKITDRGQTVVSLDFTGAADGSFTIGKAQGDTAGLAGGNARRCRWSLELVSGGQSVQVWMPTNSSFVIYQED